MALTRKTPLRQKTPLRSAGGLSRGRQPRRQQAAVRRTVSPNNFSPEVRAVVERRSGGRCEAGTPNCTARAAHHHHIKSRRAGDNTADNDLHVCGPCHEYIHSHPREAREKGWIRPVNDAG